MPPTPPPPPPANIHFPPDPRSPRPSLPQIASFDFPLPPDASHTTPSFETRFGQLSRRLRDDRDRRNAVRDAEASIRQRIRRIQHQRRTPPASSSTSTLQRDMDRSRRFSPPSQALLDELEEANRALQSERAASTIAGRPESPNASSSRTRHSQQPTSIASYPTPGRSMPGTPAVTTSRTSQSHLPSFMHRAETLINASRALSQRHRLARRQLEQVQSTPANVAMADVEARSTGIPAEEGPPAMYSASRTTNSMWATGGPRRRSRLSVASLRPANSSLRSEIAQAYRESLQRPLNRRRRVPDSEDPDMDTVLPGPVANTGGFLDMATDSDSDLNERLRHRYLLKRPKLVHDGDSFDGYDPVKYGWNGQVDPGLLRLEIVSCDGGEFSRHSSVYRAENVLQDDTSVYCSKASKCTLLFRHQSETSFNVESIFIRGPDTGYTSPVQQGIVFIGMCAEKLLYSAAAYRMTYADLNQPNPSKCYGNCAEMRDGDAEYSQHTTRGQPSYLIPSDVWEFGSLDMDCDWPGDVTSTQAQLTTAPSPPYDFGESDSSSDVESGWDTIQGFRRPIYHHRNTRVNATGTAAASHQPGDHDDHPTSRRFYDGSNDARGQRCICGSYKSRIEKVVPPGSNGDDILDPNAEFRVINKLQKNINMQFKAPIAGRYILLKLFNPNRESENIDVQYVAVHGFSGPRYFPNIEFR